MTRIGRATSADAGEILTVQRAAFLSEAQLHGDPNLPPLTETLEQLRASIERETVLAAHNAHGRLIAAVRGRLAAETWLIGRLVVAPDQQGHGLGARMLDAIEACAPRAAVDFELFTGPRSTANVRFYQRRGYRTTASQDGLIHLTKPRETQMSEQREATASSLFTKIDHVGIAVGDLDEAIAFYRDTFGVLSVHEETNTEQGVREAMLAVGDGTTRIQLLAPLHADSTIAKFLDRSGPGVQQVAYTVEDIDAVSQTLRERGMRLLYEQARSGTAGSRVNFIHPKDARGVLVEIVEPATVAGESTR